MTTWNRLTKKSHDFRGDAPWEMSDRDRLLRLVEKLPNSIRVGISHRNERQYTVFRVWESRSVHVTFDERIDDGSRAVYVTRRTRSDTLGGIDATAIEWLRGGIRAWIDALEIDRDALIEAFLL